MEAGRLLERIREIGEQVIRPAAADVDQAARFPSEALEALKAARALSAYVPRELGGAGLAIRELATLCETLGQYDGSVAMIYAMHSIQVACLVHHGRDSAYFRRYLSEVAERQLLMASATTEVGTGGDLRSSVCAIELAGDRFTLAKKAPVISYGRQADDLLITCRRDAASPAADQVLVLARRADCGLEEISGWDTLGFRGTCSSGFAVSARGAAEQILPVPFAAILSRTMHPVSHLLWSSLWLGLAEDAVRRAHGFVRIQARRSPGVTPPAALRLAEVDVVLQTMRSTIAAALHQYERILASGAAEEEGFRFAIDINNLKLASSTLVVDIVGRALLVCGIEGYRNDSKHSLCRHLRDAYGAALMVNNDRIAGHNATMLLAQREGAKDG
jgi:acyl-CoA dehydrogenase